MVFVTKASFNLIGIVCDSLIGLGKTLTVELTSAGTFHEYLIDLPLGSSRICLKSIPGEINLSSNPLRHQAFPGKSFYLPWHKLEVCQLLG